MFLFKNTKSIVKRIALNMVVYGFASVFVLMMLAVFLPKIIAKYIYDLMVISSLAAIIGLIVSIVWFIYELTPYAINKQIKREINISNRNIIYSYGVRTPGHLFESVELKKENGVHYYITVSMIDKWHGGGEKLPVPDIFIKSDSVDINGLLVYIANKHSYMNSMKEYRTNKNINTNNLSGSITILVEYLRNNNYNIDFKAKEMTIVKQSDDPWNHFNTFIAKADGVYNYVEVQMGGYDEKKRVSCFDYETACFLTLALFVSRENSPKQDTLLAEIKKHADIVLKNSTDCWRGQFIIDELISLIK